MFVLPLVLLVLPTSMSSGQADYNQELLDRLLAEIANFKAKIGTLENENHQLMVMLSDKNKELEDLKYSRSYCQYPGTCQQIHKLGFASGNYHLDLLANFTSIKVHCDFSKNQTITMIEPNGKECNATSKTCHFPYENLDQIKKLILDPSQNCQQNLTLACDGQELQNVDINGYNHRVYCNTTTVLKSSLPMTSLSFKSPDVQVGVGPLSCRFSIWTLWSEFSSCSTTCGKGIQVRTRQCLARDVSECTEKETDSKACLDTAPCNDVFVLIASGFPEPDGGTELINWSQRKHCTKYISYWGADLTAGASGAMFNNTPLICGGGQDTIRNSCWNLNYESWQKAPIALKEKRSNHATLRMDDKIIISGGLDSSGYDKLASSEFILENGYVIEGPDLQEPMHGHCMALFQDQIWVLSKQKTMVHDLNFGFLKYGPPMLDERMFQACSSISINGKEFLMVFGGTGSYPLIPELLDASTNTWRRMVMNLPSEMFYYPSILKVNDDLLLVTADDKLYKMDYTESEIEFNGVMTLQAERSKPVLLQLPSDHYLADQCFNY